MKRFWQILALMLMTLMVPASMCCFGVDGCAAQVCGSCADNEHEDGDGHDGDEHHAPTSCPSDTISHSQVPALATLPTMQMVELVALIEEMIRRQDEMTADSEMAGLVMTTAPPEMRTTWQFTHRAALPVRAPSIQA